MASTYVGTLIVVLCLLHTRYRRTLRTLARVVFAIGTTETLQFIGRSTWPKILSSLIGHLAVLAVTLPTEGTYMSHGVAVGVLLSTLLVYYLSDVWPYTSTPIVLVGLAVSIIILEL